MKTEEFIAKSREVHGDKYDYSKTVYVNQTTDVVITCPKHGDFLQRPNNHYMGAGCPSCSGNRRLTTEKFIERAKNVHGNKYDYSKVVYVNNKTKVSIICPEHGEFLQSPDKHLQGRGCPGCVRNRVEQTNLERYGVKRPLQNKDIHAKAVQTCVEKYGVENPMQTKEVLDKVVATNMARYGVPYSCMSESVTAQRNETLEERYGVHSPFASQEVRDKAVRTMVERYGVDNAAKLDTVQGKTRATCLEKYGVDAVLAAKSVRDKRDATARENGTLRTSGIEDMMFEMLCSIFDDADVERQFKSAKYPYNCDFYVKSRGLYIELNASWTHGNHWYGCCQSDTQAVDKWHGKHTEYYDNAIYIWTQLDVAKRAAAKSNNLNYLTFWCNDLSDFNVWIASGCPDGHDYDMMYSWLPRHDELAIEKPSGKLTLHTVSRYTKYYHQDIFFAHEKVMWRDNLYFRNIPLRMYMYANRLKYIHKAPSELSDKEILRGFSISGVLRGYTVFDATLMQVVIDKYGIKSVADPCVGWGERMLCCYLNNVAYSGVDVNPALRNGYDAMRHDFDMTKQSVVTADAADIKGEHCDAVITCPPYFDTEIYSENGSENLPYDDFLIWWDKVVKNFSDAKYFCFQINQKYKSDLSDIVIKNGFDFVESFVYSNNKASHFNHRGGVVIKREYEEMLVFKKGSII